MRDGEVLVLVQAYSLHDSRSCHSCDDRDSSQRSILLKETRSVSLYYVCAVQLHRKIMNLILLHSSMMQHPLLRPSKDATAGWPSL